MTKMIVPIQADDFSAMAVNQIFRGVYATQEPKGYSTKDSFEWKIKEPKFSAGPFKIELPKIHMIILNKTKVRVEQHQAAPVASFFAKALEIAGEGL